jgi:hypothetical protein
VVPEFDTGSRLLRFVSTSGDFPAQHANGISAGALDALRAGTIDEIEWDHTALGATLQLLRPAVQIGIGLDGVKRYTLLSQIGRRQPGLLERALAPVLVEPESR